MSTPTLAAQSPVLTCLATLALARPDLPAAYLTVSAHSARDVSVQLDSPAAVEAWREALGAAPDAVVADWIGGRPSLEFTATAYGIKFEVYATYTPATTTAGEAA
ncbi:hypothetical protein [Streptomyces sp. F-1]|uniref:hypothetical protein n=1 Tax=Streptomyces sp. F-1 TaxID=463642 RepID=UPI00085BD108|nr:hypothetical protein [Streptomyces sp. F-1]SFY53192.1 hypothetical protein STEPF1_06469 [Streptomyces sp. F-1]